MSNSDYEIKVCTQCGRKTKHSKTSLSWGWKLLIAFLILVPLTAVLGPLGGLGTVFIFWLVSLGCNGFAILKCSACGTKYDLKKANAFIRKHKEVGFSKPVKQTIDPVGRSFSVARDQDSIGEFSLELILSNLRRGVLLESDWYFDSSSNEWRPLSELMKR